MTSERPLAGRSVIVTRAQGAQAGELAALLAARGAQAIELPAVQIVDPPDWEPCDRAIARLADYDWIVFTSRNAVDRFLDRLEGFEERTAIAGRIAAVGEATAARLRERGRSVACVPAEGRDARAEGLLDALDAFEAADARDAGRGRAGGSLAGRNVLLPRALVARETLPEGLRARGARVDVVPVYRLAAAEDWIAGALDLLRARRVDAVCFASGATAEFFFAGLEPLEPALADLLASVCVASLGPVTSDTLRRLGHPPTVEARERSMMSLVEALGEHFAAHGGADR